MRCRDSPVGMQPFRRRRGLAYSLFPFLVLDRITIWPATVAPGSLMFIFVGTAVVLPAIHGYTVFAYRVFWGKTGSLSYGQEIRTPPERGAV
jgi:cytochrome bd-type quinol oxidase subunit 2